MKRTRSLAARTALVTAVAVVALAGCSAFSPAVITTPYPAADGIDVDLPGTDVGLRNLLVVGTAKDAPGAVVGSVTNNGASPVQVSLQAEPGTSGQPAQTVVAVPPHSSVQIGPDQTTTMVIASLAQAPGADTTMSLATQAGGRIDAQVPVVLAQAQYASLTPAAPTPTETPTPTGTATPLDSATETPTAGATPAGTETKAPKKKKKAGTEATASPTESAN